LAFVLCVVWNTLGSLTWRICIANRKLIEKDLLLEYPGDIALPTIWLHLLCGTWSTKHEVILFACVH